jgi:methionyl-tRNA formyltransferase
MRILLLCNNYHPLSVACLQALHSAGRFELTVGQVRQREGGIREFALTIFRRYGFVEGLRRGLQFAVATARIKGRNLGFSFNGYSTIQEFLQLHRLDELNFENINNPHTVQTLRERRFDVFVAGAFSQILGPEALAVPRLGALNVHLSLLPKYRGPSPCYWVMKNRERTTGVTVHFMDQTIDGGDIAVQREIPVHASESPSKLERRLAPIGAELLLDVIGQVKAGTVRRVPQRLEGGTYFSFPNSP